MTDEKKEAEDELRIINEWLKLNDKGAEALVQQNIFNTQKKRLEEEIEQTRKRISNQLPGAWRAIISSRIETRLDELDGEIKRQTSETKRIGEIETQINSLKGRLKGDACDYCGHIDKKPSLGEIDKITNKIILLEK